METNKLFMLLLGCKPPGRYIEQHDVFFGIAPQLKALIPGIVAHWPEAKGKIHIDAWREVTRVGDYAVTVLPRADAAVAGTGEQLFFINLGGYKEQEMEEFHYKLLAAAAGKDRAIQQARQTAFYRHTGFKGAASHIDDKYGVDVDDVYEITDILPAGIKRLYCLQLTPAGDAPEDVLHLGYFKLDQL